MIIKKILPAFARATSRQQSTAATASAKPAIAKSTKLHSFNWEDPLNLDSCLNDDEKMIRDHFHDYCQEKLMTRVKVNIYNNLCYGCHHAQT